MKLFVKSVLIAAAIAALLGACGKASAPPPGAEVKGAKAAPQALVKDGGLTLVDFKLGKNAAGKPVLQGNVANAATQKIAHAAVEFTLLDAKENDVGTAIASVDNLEAKFSWAFEVEVLPAGVVAAKFAGFKTR